MIKLIRRLPAREAVFSVIVIVFVVVSVWLTLAIPGYMNEITALVESHSDVSQVLSAGLMMLLCAVGDACCTVIVGYFTSQVSAGFGKLLRSEIYNHVVEFSSEEIGGFSTASLVTRTGNDVSQVQFLIVMGLQAVLRAPIIAIWSVFKIINKSTPFLIATGIAIVFVLCLIVTGMTLLVPKFRILQKLTDNINRLTEENITGVRVVRAYNAENYQRDKFEDGNRDLTKVNLFTGRTVALLMPGMQFAMNALTLAIYIIGAFVITAAAASERISLYSDLVVFMAYAMQILLAFMMVSMIFMLLPRAEVCANRINEVLDTKSRIHDPEKPVFRGAEGTVEFRNVSFRYPDAEEKVLDGITFKAEKGETIAVIGLTGCGKSTLVNLIPRFYDVTEGEVLVDGADVRDYRQSDLRNKIGYISQKATLFKGTIRSNIDYGENGRDGSDEGIIHALSVAQGEDILKKEELGIDAEVAQAGSNFSGGQKQRISIARAIYKKPEIFIFDDSFSALDYKTDKQLRAALHAEISDATCIIVAQRIGTVKDADKIIVLEDGKIAGLGTHSELLKGCSVYRQIAESQLSKEELENA